MTNVTRDMRGSGGINVAAKLGANKEVSDQRGNDDLCAGDEKTILGSQIAFMNKRVTSGRRARALEATTIIK